MANLGIDLEELMDLLSRGHEAVFSLDGKEYIIQTEADEAEQNDLVMYQCKPTVEYLCRIPNGLSQCGFQGDFLKVLSVVSLFDSRGGCRQCGAGGGHAGGQFG